MGSCLYYSSWPQQKGYTTGYEPIRERMLQEVSVMSDKAKVTAGLTAAVGVCVVGIIGLFVWAKKLGL